MGNVQQTLGGIYLYSADDPHVYDRATGRLLSTVPVHSTTTPAVATVYDSAGNQVLVSRARVAKAVNLTTPTFLLWTNTQNAYDAAGRLRFVRERPDSTRNLGYLAQPTEQYADEETRYDALGRRVWLQSKHVDDNVTCGIYCSVQRFVWDGDQLLGEFRMPVSPSTSENDVNVIATRQAVRDSTGVIPILGADSITAYSWRWGSVVYAHGHGIDQPIALTRIGGGPDNDTLLVSPLTMYPHLDWRGNATTVSFDGGYPLNSGSIRTTPPLPNESNFELSAYRVPNQLSWEVTSWTGSLLNGQFGETGLEYHRNRYYDPQQGRFTQEDPLGLAGGMNLYGFAGGDPVNFSDPLGLCFWDLCIGEAMAADVAAVGLVTLVTAAYIDGDQQVRGLRYVWFSKSSTSGEDPRRSRWRTSCPQDMGTLAPASKKEVTDLPSE